MYIYIYIYVWIWMVAVRCQHWAGKCPSIYSFYNFSGYQWFCMIFIGLTSFEIPEGTSRDTAMDIPLLIFDRTCVVKDTCALFPASSRAVWDVFWGFVTAVGRREDEWKFSWKVPDVGTIFTSGGNPVDIQTKDQSKTEYQLVRGWIGVLHTTGIWKEIQMQLINSKWEIWCMISGRDSPTSQANSYKGLLMASVVSRTDGLIGCPKSDCDTHPTVVCLNKQWGTPYRHQRDLRFQLHVNNKHFRFRVLWYRKYFE